MRLGVIDVGSTTVQMLVVNAHHGGPPLPEHLVKSRLAMEEHREPDGTIGATWQERVVDLVTGWERAEGSFGVDQLLAFATSSLREAPNADAVHAAISGATGVELVIPTGQEEAELTFLAARRWMGWAAGNLLVLDIGSANFEAATGMSERPDLAVSLPLGASRVTRTHLPGDPPSADAVAEARRAVRARLASELRPLLKAPRPDRVAGASKTLRSLARLSGERPSSEGPYAVRMLRRHAITSLVGRLADLDASARAQLPGVSAARASQVLGGAIVAEAAMDLLGLDALEICPWALREGMILRRLDALA